MPEKPENKDFTDSAKNKSEENCEDASGKDSWSEDQKNRSYYYDDASGYEIYLPEDEDEEDKPEN